jgi:hypothetical protein
MTSAKGFAYRDLTQHGHAEVGNLTMNVGKALPASTTGNLFGVTGVIVVHGMVGVVSTVFSSTAVHITLGVTGFNAAIAAAPASAYASTAAGSYIILPQTGGGALPAAVTTAQNVACASEFIVNAANITITTDATNTGAVTWLLFWEAVYPKGSSVAVTAS